MEAWVGYGLLFISLAVFCASLGFLYLLAQRFAKLSVGPGEVLEVVSRGGTQWHHAHTTLWLAPWTTRRHHRFQDAPGAPSFILCNTILTITLDMEATTVEGVTTRFKLSTEIDLDENHRSWAKLPVWQHYARSLHELTIEEISERSLHSLRQNRRPIAQKLVREFYFTASGVRKIQVHAPIEFDAEIEDAFQRELHAMLERRIDDARGPVQSVEDSRRAGSSKRNDEPAVHPTLSEEELETLQRILGTDRATAMMMAGTIQSLRDSTVGHLQSPRPTPSQG